MTEFGPADLDAFVAKVDSFGGPGFPGVDDYWREFTYAPVTSVDTNLDPFGSAYFDQQIALYQEISGRTLDQNVNEHTVFDHGPHLMARNPYNHGEPGVLANQLVQLAMAIRLANPRAGARMVDMGCGWGLSSELGSYVGLQVEAVDINPDFVALVRERSERYRYDIKTTQAAFDDYVSDAPGRSHPILRVPAPCGRTMGAGRAPGADAGFWGQDRRLRRADQQLLVAALGPQARSDVGLLHPQAWLV